MQRDAAARHTGREDSVQILTFDFLISGFSFTSRHFFFFKFIELTSSPELMGKEVPPWGQIPNLIRLEVGH